MDELALKRWRLCRQNRCPHDINFEDPDAVCPEGHWDPNTPDASVPGSSPTLPQKIASFAKANVDEVRAIFRGVAPITEEEAQRRLAICRECEDFLPELEECRLCGCPMARKTWYRASKCPVGKW